MSTPTTDASPYFDISNPSFSVASAEVMEARERSWYARTNYGLAILRYDEVSRLLKDRRLKQGSAAWPIHHGVTEGPFVEWWGNGVLNREGEDHARLRRLLNPSFSPRLINELAPRFRALGDELIDAFAADGRCEFMSAFAEPYAARVVTILLGTPEDEWKTIADWSNDVGLALGVTVKQDLPRVEAALQGLFGYADELVADRRRSPREDFVTHMVHARDHEDRLSDVELRDAIALLIFGGMDTTRNQLGLALTTFMEHPDQWRLLAEQPELGPRAVEEVMRTIPTVTWVTREAAEDLEFQGLEIAQGTTIHLLTQSAGTDPRQFGAAGFDITAERARQYGFGGGMHHCLGHFVARLDMAEALALLARRLHDPRVDGEATYLPRSGNWGPIALPIAFDAAPAERTTEEA
jgi:cytochrome P450